MPAAARPRASSPVTAGAQSAPLLAALRADSSPHALRPADPSFLANMVALVHETVDEQTPSSTLSKDRKDWSRWEEFLALFGSDPLRPTPTDDFTKQREGFLQAAFVVWVYPRLKPRRRTDLIAKPDSAHNCLTSVRRVHARRGVQLPTAPMVSRLLRALIKRYIREHGLRALLPQRKEPLQNEHVHSMLAVEEGTQLGAYNVAWSSHLFICFTALVTGCRHIGGRKADLIAPSHEEWDISRFARGNVTYVIDGRLVIDPSPEQFRSMKDGDRVNARPGVSKADQLGTKYGDKDVPLPYRPDDPLNAAARMVALELALPVRGERRASTPFFTMNAELECLSHTVADSLFAKLAFHALGKEIADTLSLHSGRIWKAVALHALDVDIGTIQACCNWASPESAKVYARLLPQRHADLIDKCNTVNVTATLTRNFERAGIAIDNDATIAALQQQLNRLEERLTRAASPATAPRAAARPSSRAATPPPATSPAGADDGDSSDSSDDDDGTSSLVVNAGDLVDPTDLAANLDVAVAFDVAGGHERYFRGVIAKVMAARARVRFPDVGGMHVTYDVDHVKIHHIAA